eukprot:c26255_g1_i1 orf=398-1558(+)
MGLLATTMILPLGILFFLSGLIINAIQVLTFILLLPFSRNLYRIANAFLTELLWSELVWLMDWWAGVQIRLYVNPEEWKHAGKEHALCMSNHHSDIDWLVGWVLAQRVGCLGSTRAVMKKSTIFLPVIGWSMWFSEYLFLERSWAKDEKVLKLSFQRLRDFPRPFWLALFVEGTRFTEAKLHLAQEYAVSAGLPVPRNVLIPRTKGFVSAITNLRPSLAAVYDMTVAVPKESPPPTMLRLLKGQPSVIHLHVRRCLVADLPETEDGLSHWCKETFVSKDDLLDKHRDQNTFGEELYIPIPRPFRPLLIVMGWSLVLLATAGRLLRPMLLTWVGMFSVAGGLFGVLLFMHFLISFSQSEKSTSAKAARRSHPDEKFDINGNSELKGR